MYAAVGVLVSAAAGVYLAEQWARPEIRIRVAQQRELSWATYAMADSLASSRTDTWDVFGHCLLTQAMEQELAIVDSILPFETNLVTRLVVANVGRREATNVRLAIVVDSLDGDHEWTVESPVPHAFGPDTTQPGLSRGLPEDVAGVRILTLERLPKNAAVVIELAQRYEHTDGDSTASAGIPAVKAYVQYVVSTELGVQHREAEAVPMYSALADATIAPVLMGRFTRRRGYLGSPIIERTAYVKGITFGDRQLECKVPARFKY